MPNKINLVTPPDSLHNNNFSISLINLTQQEKETVSIFLGRQEDNREINLFAYSNDKNPTWLLNSVRWNDTPVYINIDNCSDISVQYISYMLSKSNVFYSTQDANTKETYSLINVNQVENIDEFLDRVYNE